LKLFQFPFRERAGVMEEPAYKRRFPMIDVADDHDFKLLSRS